MNRLTKKVDDYGYGYKGPDYLPPMELKLGQLEDVLEKYNLDNANDLDIEIRSNRDKVYKYESIEKELGIDLLTLNKLRKSDKIYVKFFYEIQEYTRFKIDLRECKILYGYMNGKGYGLKQPLSNYNKLFSLSKEELENE